MLLMIAAAHKYKCFAIVDCRRSGRGLPVRLEGGPLDGALETIPLLSAGVMACRTWPDGDDGGLDYFYSRTKRRDADGRVVCRYGGKGVRA